jgi:preprotein translocase subunit SecG
LGRLLDKGPRVILYAVLAIQIASALALVFLVLLHSGKGGGLSDMFGGGLGASAAGSTVVEKNLDRLTIVCALVFAFSTIGLSLLIDA